MQTDPREIIQLCDRLQAVIIAEFPHLSPPDCVFALKMLGDEYIGSFVAICEVRGLIPKPKIS